VIRRLVQCAVALAVIASALPSSAADVEAGRRLAEACQACHGSNGVSQIEGTPSLAGQPDQFVQWQLVFFRSGRRKSEVMQPLAEALSDADVRNLGAYFTRLPPPPRAPGADKQPDLSRTGRTVAQRNRCVSCHTDSFAGTQATARLAHQREEYLVKALHDYRTAARPSTGIAAMNEVAAALDDSQIVAVAHYLALLP
jgi:cytochrome c553